MLIKESQLRAIIREELIREHQELLVENFLQKLGKKGSKLLPGLTLFLAFSLNTACDGVDKMLGGPTQEEISARESAEAMGTIAQKFGENVDVSVVGMQNAKEIYKQIDSSIRYAKRTLKDLDKRNFKDSKDKEAWRSQILRSVTALKQLKDQVEKNGGFADLDMKAQEEALRTNKELIKNLGEILGWKNFDGSYTVK